MLPDAFLFILFLRASVCLSLSLSLGINIHSHLIHSSINECLLRSRSCFKHRHIVIIETVHFNAYFVPGTLLYIT